MLSSLSKYDGRRTRQLQAREFHQIAGRAGRAGYDTAGTVVVQAPEHEVENVRLLAKAGDDEKKRRRVQRKKAPEGFVSWSKATHDRLLAAAPEPLGSHFRVSPLDAAQRHRPARGRLRRDALAADRQPRTARGAAAARPVGHPGLPGAAGRRGDPAARRARRHRPAGAAHRGPAAELRAQPPAVDVRAGRHRAARPGVRHLRPGRAVGDRGHPGGSAPGALRPGVQGPRRGGRAAQGRGGGVRGADGPAGGRQLPAPAGRGAGGGLSTPTAPDIRGWPTTSCVPNRSCATCGSAP